jgi:hypothetical protein
MRCRGLRRSMGSGSWFELVVAGFLYKNEDSKVH